jgi:hypothetical protein
MIMLLFASTFVFAQQNNDARSTVEKFYKFYRTRNSVVSTHELNLIKPWFTVGLTKLFQNEIKREADYLKKHTDDKPHFGDGFPFTPYDECVIDNKIILNKLEFSERKLDINKAIVEVTFMSPKDCGGEFIDAYNVELLKSKNRWLINDWIYSDQKTLTEDLKREDY